MTIGITGASGFIGSSLLAALAGEGHEVIALGRAVILPASRYFDLAKPYPRESLSGVDILIHCAFVHPADHEDAGRLNYEGTRKLINEAREAGIRKIIFFSTLSAHAEALSVYGKTKYREEALFDPVRDVIFKCGLVVGSGGLFLQLLKQTLSRRVLPVVQGGGQPLQVIAIDDVVQAVKNVISNDLGGVFVLANRQQFSYKDVFKTIASVWQRPLLFVPLPFAALRLMVWLARAFGIAIPFNNENIEGLRALRYFDPRKSLASLSLQPMELEKKLRQLKNEGQFLS